MPRLAPLALLAVTTMLTALAPAVSAGASAQPCSQDGVLVQLGLHNQYTCDGPCENDGVTAIIGLTGAYDCTSCSNGGVFVFTGDTACGGRVFRACAGDACVGPNAATPCGVVTDPACWSQEFAGRMQCMAATVVHDRPPCR